MVTAHSNMFESSTSPAEKPSTGFLVSSASTAEEVRRQYMRGPHTHWQQLAGRTLHDHLLTASSASLWHSPSCCCYCTSLASTQQRVAHPATTGPHNQPFKRASDCTTQYQTAWVKLCFAVETGCVLMTLCYTRHLLASVGRNVMLLPLMRRRKCLTQEPAVTPCVHHAN